MNAGSAVPSMTTDILNNMQIIIPNEDVLEHFDSLVSAFYVQIKHNVQESSRLAELRDTLLPKLMSGQIKVNDIENLFKIIDKLFLKEYSITLSPYYDILKRKRFQLLLKRIFDFTVALILLVVMFMQVAVLVNPHRMWFTVAMR